jgi:hypothetical protein
MSDVCDPYLIRAKSTVENQYVSLRNVISDAIQRQGWKVEQISFVTGSRSIHILKTDNESTRIRTLDTSRPDKYKRWRKESHEAKDK